MPTLIWFREDLRVNDQTAFYEACKFSTDGVIGVYLITGKTWQEHSMADCRVNFVLQQLVDLKNSLNKLNIPLIIKNIDTYSNSANILLDIANTYRISALFFNKQYEIDELRRDEAVVDLLSKHQIKVFSYDDQVILPPTAVFTQSGNYFSVFTPYKKAWIKKITEIGVPFILPIPKKQKALDIPSDIIPSQIMQFEIKSLSHLWPAGEQKAKKRLEEFIANKIQLYNKKRDLPADDYTSKLSPYLATGILSPRQCLHAALSINKNQFVSGKEGATSWINELIWREFYKQIIFNVPRVCMNKPYQLNTDKLPWSYDEKLIKAWQEGRTGYPIVDAAMRQLNQTGWMHNRCRMITAMFLSKILFVNWRIGEKYFMQHLIDGDFSANNGGWQWCASTGTDAAPYFRIFNPLLQSKKFDPNGDYIKRYCPELSDFEHHSIHQPYKDNSIQAKAVDYPPPIIDYAKAREHTLREFKKLKDK